MKKKEKHKSTEQFTNLLKQLCATYRIVIFRRQNLLVIMTIKTALGLK